MMLGWTAPEAVSREEVIQAHLTRVVSNPIALAIGVLVRMTGQVQGSVCGPSQ